MIATTTYTWPVLAPKCLPDSNPTFLRKMFEIKGLRKKASERNKIESWGFRYVVAALGWGNRFMKTSKLLRDVSVTALAATIAALFSVPMRKYDTESESQTNLSGRMRGRWSKDLDIERELPPEIGWL